MTKRRSFLGKFKATVALEALRGDRTAHEIAAKRQGCERLDWVSTLKVRDFHSVWNKFNSGLFNAPELARAAIADQQTR